MDLLTHKRRARGRGSSPTPLAFFVARDAIDHLPGKSMKFVHSHWALALVQGAAIWHKMKHFWERYLRKQRPAQGGALEAF